jgi:uncharacterized protein YraI
MKISTMLASATLFASLLMSNTAFAAVGYITSNVNLRAGPSGQYPIVNKLRAGKKLTVYGCLDDWDWCEVSSRNDRGWISGAFLQILNHHQRIRVVEAAPVVVIPTIRFDAGNYWDEHYRDRPFYHDRERWVRGPDRQADHHNDPHDHDDHHH